MIPHDEELTPDTLDEQIDRLRQPGERPTPTTRLIQHLNHIYEDRQAGAGSVQRVRQRLMERGAIPAAARRLQSRLEAAPQSLPARAETEAPLLERCSSARSLPGDWQSPPEVPQALPRWRWNLAARLTTLAAAIALLALTGGLVAGLVLVRQHSAGSFTPGTAACPSRATATAEAWFPLALPPDFAGGQIAGTINNGPVSTLSDFHYPLNIPPDNASNSVSSSFMAWSPDARYLAVAVSAPNDNVVYAYLVDTTTHATTPIPIPTQADGSPWPGWYAGRIFAWANNQTLLLFYGGASQMDGSAGPTYSYNVTTRTLTLLPGVQAAEGVVRCSILFYLELTAPKDQSGTDTSDALLHHYDLKMHREIGQPVNLGAAYQDSGGVAARLLTPPWEPAWDVSPDGTRLVYQQVESGGPFPKQQFFVANSDGTNPQPIYSPQPTDRFTFIRISPNGQFVILIRSLLIISVSITGGPIRMYGNSAGNEAEYPGWLPDSSGFDVVNTTPTQGGFSEPFVARYLLSTPVGADGFVPGTVVAPAVQSLAVLS